MTEISYGIDDTGDGPTVVFLHGLAEDRTSWQTAVDDLSGRHRVAVDLRGHGETTLGQPDGTLRQLVDDLVTLVSRLRTPVTGVGFSLGGTVMLAAAAERPDLFGHAVVLGTSSVVGRRARGFFEDRATAAERGDLELVRKLLHEDTRVQLHDPNDLDAIVATRVRAIGDGRGYANAARAMLDLADHPLTPQLRDITCHVDVVGGEHDVVCPRRAADLLLEGLPDATYHEVPAAGHLMTIDAPDRVVHLLDQLIRKDPA